MNETNDKPYLKIGLIVGGIGIILFLLQAILSGGLILNGIFGFINLVVFILVPILIVNRVKKQTHEYDSFGAIFKTVFFGLVIAGVLSTGFTMLYINVIDPDYVDEMVYKSLEAMSGMMEGMPEAQRTEALQKSKDSMEHGFTPLGMLRSFGLGLILYAVLAAILGLAMRRTKPPVEL